MVSTILAALLSLSGTDAANPQRAGPTYARSTKFSAVRLSYGEYVGILGRAHTVIEKANGSHKGTLSYETMEATDGLTRIESAGVFSSEDLSRTPPVAYDVSYRYHNDGAPISGLTVWFTDFSRTLTIERKSPEHVDALFAMLTDEINEHTTFLGGPAFRRSSGSLMFLVASLALSLGVGRGENGGQFRGTRGPGRVRSDRGEWSHFGILVAPDLTAWMDRVRSVVAYALFGFESIERTASCPRATK